MAKKKRRGIPKLYRRSANFHLHLDYSLYQRVKELAETQSLYWGKTITMQDLIRGALHFTFVQNELLREFFRRRKKYGNTKFRF